LDLKHLLKRGALLVAANWQTVVIQFVAETTFQVLLAVPIIGAAILVAVLLGADLADLLQGSLRDIFTTIASALLSEPVALVAFIAAFSVVLFGGSVLMFVVKGGTVEVLAAASLDARGIERQPLTLDLLKHGSRFTLERFTGGCTRLFRPYLVLGIVLIAVYAVSIAGYLAFVVYGYRAAEGRALIIGWTLIATLAAALLVAWFTVVNLLYLLVQIAIAVDGVGVGEGVRAAARFIRAELRELMAVFLVVAGLVVGRRPDSVRAPRRPRGVSAADRGAAGEGLRVRVSRPDRAGRVFDAVPGVRVAPPRDGEGSRLDPASPSRLTGAECGGPPACTGDRRRHGDLRFRAAA